MTDITDIPVKCVCGVTFYVRACHKNNPVLRCPKCKGRIKELIKNRICTIEIDYGDAHHMGKRCDPVGKAISQ